MRLSIITPCKDDQLSLIKCLKSTANYTDDIEHIVLDASSLSILSKHTNILEEFPHLSYFHENDNGPAHALAKGLTRAKGKYVAFLMANDEFINQNLKVILNDIKDKTSSILVYQYIVYSEQDIEKRKIKANAINEKFSLKKFLFEEFYLSRMIIDRKVIAKIGGVNETLKIANDRDLILRLYFERLKIETFETPILKFCFDGNSMSNGKDINTKLRILDEHLEISQSLLNRTGMKLLERRRVNVWRKSLYLHKMLILTQNNGPANFSRVLALALSHPLIFLSLYWRKHRINS